LLPAGLISVHGGARAHFACQIFATRTVSSVEGCRETKKDERLMLDPADAADM